jgi:hypothetical protein
MKGSKMIQYIRNPLESWPELKKRHFREKIELLECVKRYTIKQAANILNIEHENLRTLARFYKIKFERAQWPSKKKTK